jgi:archaetidylinositol phosphate synthase
MCTCLFHTNVNVSFLWVSSIGLAVNWFGDSLDGTLSRVRNIQRPIYGFFIDHNVDGMTIIIICVGAGLSPFISFPASMMILAGYLLLSIFTYINTFLKNEFIISYSKLGPTEMRLAIIIINTLFFFIPAGIFHFTIDGVTLNLIDMIALCIALILFALYVKGFLSEKRNYGKMDPPHTAHKKTID